MKSLFAKIFVCFLLSHILAALVAFALMNATRPQLSPRPPERRQVRGAEPLRRRHGPPPGKLGLVRWLAALLAATGVSYGLARYLTAPTARLRHAAQRLAAGDLSVRVAPRMGKRRDELADLGRDFDLMAERIQSLLAAERRLLGDISHELRSPLARMQVALDLADQSADEQTRSYLQRIEREGARLNDLIGQLLLLTRLETAAVETRREKIDLAELVLQVAADADFEARRHNRSVRVTQSVAAQTFGNTELLRRAIENVARNAVRYTTEKSVVEIALRRESACGAEAGSTPGPGGPKANHDYVRITVRDFGPGVPEASLSKLFDPFYRIASARDRQSGGVGLGLSIAARALRFHGGEITARNAEGGGLLVEMRLPLLKAEG
jgi:two-component system sensor histidine kinase CpxA